jgi:hypothetical protein
MKELSLNEKLNRAPGWKNTKCYKCGRNYPKTILNIEGIIHHNSRAECIDKKSCRRARRKK